MNGIFTAGDVVIRVGRVTADPGVGDRAGRAARRHAGVRSRARPPMRSSTATLTATAWERLAIVDAEPDWREVGRMVRRRARARPADDVPDGYPMPPAESFPWWDFDALLAEVGDELDHARARRPRGGDRAASRLVGRR